MEMQHPEVLDRIAVILVRPTGDGNVGQVARAMRNFGLSRLILIDPPDLDTELARKMATRSYDLVENAEVYDTLSEALQDFHFVAGTSRRLGRFRRRFCTSQALPQWLLPQMGADNRAALVFGNEVNGLSMEEMDLCNQLVEVETDPAHRSLNLAQAVVIVAYELFSHAAETPADTDAYTPADHKTMESMYEHMRRIYLEIGFLDDDNPERIIRALRRLYSRAAPDDREVRILRGILQDTEWYLNRVAKKGVRDGHREMARDGES